MIKRIKADLIIDTDELNEQYTYLWSITLDENMSQSERDYLHGVMLLLEEIQDQCTGSSHASEGEPSNEQ